MMITKLAEIIDKLSADDYIHIYDLWCNSEDGDADSYIYKMSEFDEMHKELRPTDILTCVSGSFDIFDSYWVADDTWGDISFTTLEDLKKHCPFTGDMVLWLLNEKVKTGVPAVDKFIKNNVDWDEVRCNIRDEIEAFTNDLFVKYQKRLKIKSGDISPMDDNDLSDYTCELACGISTILYHQKVGDYK